MILLPYKKINKKFVYPRLFVKYIQLRLQFTVHGYINTQLSIK